MRVAVCFSGTLRYFKTCYPSFKKYVLDSAPYQFDIFVGVWNSKINYIKQNIPDEGTLEDMNKLYKPVDYSYEIYNDRKKKDLYRLTRMKEFQRDIKLEAQPKRQDDRWNKSTVCKKCGHKGSKGDSNKCRICGGEVIHNQIGMFYNIWKVNQLKLKYEQKHNFTYDFVIRNRFDNYFLSPLLPEYYLDSRNGITIPEGFDDFIEYGHGLNDQLAFGTSKHMDVYSDIYNNLYDLAKCLSKTKYGYGIPHKAIEKHLKNNDINIIRVPLRYVIYARLDLYNKKVKKLKDEVYKELRV